MLPVFLPSLDSLPPSGENGSNDGGTVGAPGGLTQEGSTESSR